MPAKKKKTAAYQSTIQATSINTKQKIVWNRELYNDEIPFRIQTTIQI